MVQYKSENGTVVETVKVGYNIEYIIRRFDEIYHTNSPVEAAHALCDML